LFDGVGGSFVDTVNAIACAWIIAIKLLWQSLTAVNNGFLDKIPESVTL
jgi:hypothetical protein